MHSSHVHTIFWQPSVLPVGVLAFSTTPVTYQSAVNSFFARLEHDDGLSSNAYSVDTQYYEATGGTKSYIGYSVGFSPGEDAYTDPNPYPATSTSGLACTDKSDEPGQGALPVCLTALQLANEIATDIVARHWSAGPESIFLIYTPKGVGSCFGEGESSEVPGDSCAYTGEQGYCAYHNAFEFGVAKTEVIFANMPYGATPNCDDASRPEGSDAGPAIDAGSHEHNEALTDPTGEGWWDSVGSEATNADYGQEIADLCVQPSWAEMFGPLLPTSSAYGTPGAFNQLIAGAPYLLQREWSNGAGTCEQRLPSVSFAVPGSATTGQPVTLVGNATTDSSASPIVSYEWTFGDANASVDGPDSATAATASHSFCAPGTYQVTLAVSDQQDDPGSITRSLNVTGTNRCSPTPEPTSQPVPTSTPELPALALTPTTSGSALPALPASTTPTPALTAAQVARLFGLPKHAGVLNWKAKLGHAQCAPACSVVLRLYASVKRRVHGRLRVRRLVIGSATLALPVGAARTVVVRLNAAGRALLARRKRLTAFVRVSLSDPEGHSWVISSVVVLAKVRAQPRRRR